MTTPISGPCCGNCRFRRRRQIASGPHTGEVQNECRFGLKDANWQSGVLVDEFNHGWPSVFSDEWCGNHQPEADWATSTHKSLALAVLAGDAQAARALADAVVEAELKGEK